MSIPVVRLLLLWGRCGKPNCPCHQPNVQATAPSRRLAFNVDGNTVTESLPDQAAARKAESEIAEFRKSQVQICQLRPSEPDTMLPKETAEAIRQEVTREVDQLLRLIYKDHRKTGHLELEAL